MQYRNPNDYWQPSPQWRRLRRRSQIRALLTLYTVSFLAICGLIALIFAIAAAVQMFIV